MLCPVTPTMCLPSSGCYRRLRKPEVQSILQGMLEPAQGQPATGRQPGLEERSQKEKMLELRLTQRAHRNPTLMQAPSAEHKGKARIFFFCSYERNISDNKSLS